MRGKISEKIIFPEKYQLYLVEPCGKIGKISGNFSEILFFLKNINSRWNPNPIYF